jgi:cytochrome c
MAESCTHISDNNFTKSLQGRKIYKDQCVRCFRDAVTPP